MSKALCLTIVAVLAWTSVAGAQQKAFRDLCWGDPPSVLGPAIMLGSPPIIPNMTMWARVNEDLLLGTAVQVKAIAYGFLDGCLAMVLIVGDQLSLLSSVAWSRFGRPTPAYSTPGTDVHVTSETVCIVQQVPQGAVMILMSPATFDTWARHIEEAVEAAAKDF